MENIYYIKEGQCFKRLIRHSRIHPKTGKKVYAKNAKALAWETPVDCYYCNSCK